VSDEEDGGDNRAGTGDGASQGGAALEVLGLRKRYGETVALNGVDLTVNAGERFGLLGPNGAGKTTLVSIVSTLLHADSGTVRVGGKDARGDANAVRALIGLAPQETGLYASFSALENLDFFAGLYGLRGAERSKRVQQAIEDVGLGEHARKRVATYSGGMKRRLNLAVALLHRPALLLLDEPTVGVDPQSRRHILDSIRELNRTAGTTVIYTTHYMEEVQDLCERVAIIDRGEIVAVDAIARLLAPFGAAVILFRAPANDAFQRRLQAELRPCHFALQDGVYQIGADRPEQAIPELLRIAAEERAPVDDLRVTNPSLEQVFLSYTGRELRD
jgi:ABC-2 type transport system ATP-binding protein